ncbi:MAG TPA: MSMEG_0565 family glycosyltransferase [Solirubrobacteraceae bacterium]|jgi:glycosyltransferase-like protein
MRVALLTYSVKPRGGVVHALNVAEALAARGHAAELFAIGPPGTRFFREPAVPAYVVPHVPVDHPFDARIAGMIEAYAEGLRDRLAGFDVVHAQDCISANAALALRDEGAIAAVLRTVHHVDDFRSPALIACQERSIVAPDALLCVSQPWVRRLREDFGVHAGLVRNGVDTRRHRPPRDAAEREADRAALDCGERFVVLAVGGIEPRKGSLALLDALAALPEALLVVAGGATLFDYRDELERFAARRAALGLGDERVRILGPVSDAELERLYRAADALAFPSVQEGFGLVVLEALASELPVVASDLDVLHGVVADGESALLVPPGDGAALGRALARLAGDRGLADRLRAAGRAVVARFGWDAAAEAHERAYAQFLALAAR